MSFADHDPIYNTWSMPLDPQSPEEYHELDPPKAGRGLRLMPVFTGDLFKQAVCYPVIVEMWEKAKCGRHKRRYHKEFTQAERNKIARYYGRFYKWHLVSGPPKRISMRLSTLALLQRAVNFFAEC